MISPDQVEAMIKAGIPDAQIQVLTPDGEHFEVTVVSPIFEGKRLVQQHQLVYKTVQPALQTEAIHALAVKTYTPDSWAAVSQSA